MIFKQVQQVLDGTKTQTRRPVKEHEEGNRWDSRTDVINEVLIVDPNKSYPGNLRSKWLLGHTYAVQPGRGKKAVGRIRITKIRRERLGDISDEDCLAEGIAHRPYIHNPYCRWSGYYVPENQAFGLEPRIRGHTYAKVCYQVLWDSTYGHGAWERMKDEDVWILDFERSEG